MNASLAMLMEFAEDMFPAISIEDIGVRPADDAELMVSVRAGGSVAANLTVSRCHWA